MRTIHLPIQVETEIKDGAGNRQPAMVAHWLRNAVWNDAEQSKGLQNVKRGLHILKAIDGLEKSCILKLEEDEHRALVASIERMTWGPVGFYMLPVLEKIKDAPEDPTDDKPDEKKKTKKGA